MKRLLLAGAATLALGTAAVLAVHAAAPEHEGRAMRLQHFDLNKDGNITRGEIDQAMAADFKTADTNSNGSLDEAEFKAFHEARRAEFKAQREAAGDKQSADANKADGDRARHRGMRGDRFKRVDWNLDGSISADEFAANARTMASRMDRDGDGTITAEEREWRPWHRRDGDENKPAPDDKD